MKRSAWALILIAVLVGAMAGTLAVVDAAKYVGGEITNNTTWTRSNSPYRLTNDVSIDYGVTLTIEAGVKVDFGEYALWVGGNLIVQGTSSNKVVLYTTATAPGVSIVISSSGTTIENAVFSNLALQVISGNPKISGCYFTNNNRYTPIVVSTGTSPTINSCVFDCNVTCITVDGGSPVISNNFIRCSDTSTSRYGIYAGSIAAASIAGNNITGCDQGIYTSGYSVIEGNLFTYNRIGIRSEGSSAIIRNNTITHSSIGIGGTGTITNNTIGFNDNGILAYPPCRVNFNNLINGLPYSLVLNSETNFNYTVDATNNWWGTTDESAVNQTIYDLNDNASQGIAYYAPILNQTNPRAPTPENLNSSPNPMPTPFTQPTAVPTPTPTPTPISTPTPTPTPTPTSNNTDNNQQTSPTEQPYTPPPTPTPTPNPTKAVVPGSPLTLGSPNFTETVAQFDLQNLAKLVIIGLCIMWIIIFLMSVDRKFGKPTT